MDREKQFSLHKALTGTMNIYVHTHRDTYLLLQLFAQSFYHDKFCPILKLLG